ncbi:DNA mismatch repair endonuclease MutL [Haloimpatiens lingqiaonensis]|uniref:DNA mismatch repair endonuclease MutL n=1 Tax=Haloimpatiens lingqiaonensis TaxID=1380675 RepID=UPI0010FD7A16|nr:DNA mismatch repair endonuclease MutL [Haloimpatiens lingqiaonensis]
MKRINLLDEQTCNKIAAGEVIERPFSVVKELMENSIDAEAKNISVYIEEGGQKSIKILDDGIGIHPDDIERAFLPHATSKIKEAEDIFKINTLGFRGEALASIASVSQTIMKSKREGFDYGKEICIEGGIKTYIKDIGFNTGTSIEVNNLFYNVPARQKFLKSSSRESALISDIVSRLALVNTNIAFKLESNGRKIINTFGNGNMKDVIRAIFGKEVVDNIWYFEGHSDIASVYGYVGNEAISRKSRNKQSIFVNKRYIKSSLITAAVENAFKSFLTVNKFPFFLLFLDVYPEFIDVNVHPTKSEIKFSDDRHIFKLVFNSVHKAISENLRGTFFINEDEEIEEVKEKVVQVVMPIDLKALNNEQQVNLDGNMNKSMNNQENVKTNMDNTEVYNIRGQSEIYNKQLPKNIEDLRNNDNEKESAYNKVGKTNSNFEIINNVDENHNKELCNKEIYNKEEKSDIIKENNYVKENYFFPDINIIGQFNNSYILGEYNKELYIIDQHAAHEKVLFEKYLDEIAKRDVVVQGLLAPLIIELTYEEFANYKENEDVFKELGFVIEEFGVNSIYIREVPIILNELNIKNLFFDILNNLKNMGSGEITQIKYNKIASMACKAAVKANDKLSIMEMQKLLEDLKSTREPLNCPHGRPTIIKITLGELEKRFKRIQ